MAGDTLVGASQGSRYRLIGCFWPGLTVAFEMVFGRLVRHQSRADVQTARAMYLAITAFIAVLSLVLMPDRSREPLW